jgi:hypothetical protein
MHHGGGQAAFYWVLRFGRAPQLVAERVIGCHKQRNAHFTIQALNAKI